MAFPSRTLRAVCEISSGTLQISQRPPAYTHEAGALSVVVDLKNNSAAYVPDASIVAGMYLFWPDTQYMSELVEMGISGCTLSGTFGDALTAMPGCPLLVVQLQDTDTGDIIVAAASPIQITKVEGNLIVTTRPPSPSEIVYIGRSPYINTENYHWMQWNSVALAYEDTGVVAKGMPATFTATAQGLPAGSTPTATITGTAENPVINLGIPKGDTGETGATGPAAGFGTISATVDNTSGTPGVTVNTSGPDTAKNMTFAFTGLKGPQGEPGPVSQVCGVSPNAQGNVPLKGTNIPLEAMSLVTVKQAIDNVGATFTGATSSTAGTKGQVPAPAAGDEDKLLKGSGEWAKITGSDLEVSSSDTTKIATALSSLNDQIANLDYSNAGAHNAIYRGKYLGSSVTAEQWAQIKAGTFEDMYIGDYWTINGVNWRIAAFDYWVNANSLSTHHAVIVPDSNLASSPMNSTNTTAGAYYNSDFRKGNNSNTGRSTAITAVNNAFGSAHILTYKDYLHSAVTDGHPSGQEWADCTVELMNEEMVYGAHIFAPIANGAAVYSNYTTSKSQLPLFQHEHSRISNRANWWLRSVVSGSYFANVNVYGSANFSYASNSLGVRPAFGIFQS